MSYGITTSLAELIALQKSAQSTRAPSQQPVGMRAGGHLSRLRGRGMDFAEVRNYQAGDEIRHVEWRITARTGRPHIKLYQEERERPLVLMLDFNPSMYFGTRHAFKSVVAARLAAILAWTAIKQGDRVGGLLFSADAHSEFTPHNSHTGIMPLLAAIGQYSAAVPQTYQQSCALSQGLIRLKRVTRPGSVLILISDFYHIDPEFAQHLARLRGQNDIVVFHVCDPIEVSPPPVGRYAVTDGLQTAWLDTRNASLRQAYQQSCLQRLDAIQGPCHKLNIQYVQVMTDADLASVVRQTLRRSARG